MDLGGLPEAGKKAPAFTAASSSGKSVKLSDFKGQNVVLYFYPKDNTPGCTVEAQQFQAALGDLTKLNAVVLGVSPDDVASHCKFASKYRLEFQLLADTEHSIAEKYGVWVEKNMYGKKYMGVQRATFLIDAAGKLAQVWPKVKPEGHAADVLAALQQL
jgi:peroxiredoxin Q/BCP